MAGFLAGLGLGDDPVVPVPVDLPVLLGFVPEVGVPVRAAEVAGVAGLVADATLPGVAATEAHAPNGLAMDITFCCCCLVFKEEGVAGVARAGT